MDDTLYMYRNEGRVLGEASDLLALNPLCTRAELRAAILALTGATQTYDYVETHYGPKSEEYADALAHLGACDAHLRELLGMEAEA